MNALNRIRAEALLDREQASVGVPAVRMFGAIRQRASLVAEPQPSGIHGPPMRHFLGEVAYLARNMRQAAVVDTLPLSDHPRTVMLLPGFGTHPVRMRRMARKLESAGHTVKRWGLGFNFGPTVENFAALEARVLSLHRRHGEKIVLVGWSLGGLFAREIAKRHPHAVAKVITMGSPFSGSPKANNVWRIYHLITGHSVEAPPVVSDIAVKPPVPTVALWSPRDGIVSPRSSCGRPGERDKAVALRCSHIGFAYSDEAIEAVRCELEAG